MPSCVGADNNDHLLIQLTITIILKGDGQIHDMQTLILKKGVAVLESSKVDFRAKNITTDKIS